MSDTAVRYRRLSDAFATTLAAVSDWDARTPCDEWTAVDLARHVISTQGMFLGFVGHELNGGPTFDDDPVAAWDHARAAVQAELDDPERASAKFTGFTGETTFERSVDQFLCTDLVLHRWDLAQASGEAVRLDPAEMSHVRAAMAPLADTMRTPGAFGPELDPPPGSDEQTEFLAYFGRRS